MSSATAVALWVLLTAIKRTCAGSRPARRQAASTRSRTAAMFSATCPMKGRVVAATRAYGQRAPREIRPSAARMAKTSPKPAYREVTSRSTFSLPTELPMSA